MSVAFFTGKTLGSNDLNITIRDTIGTLIDPYSLFYAIYDNTTGVQVLIGSPATTPVHVSTGQYYAQWVVPADANIGDYLIRWNIQETSLSPVVQSVQEFNVVADNVITGFTGNPYTDGLIHSLRILLRDNNPDRNYRFRPPSSERFIQSQTQVFGYIWEDEELLEYLYFAIDDFNTRPPVTDIDISQITSGPMRRWKTAILLRAGAFACFAIAMNWIAEEFSYSISGVSLDIEKSSKYQSMKENYINEYDKVTEAAKASIKIVKGLRQARYGIGITSALGPVTGPGTLSRKNWIMGDRPTYV